MPQRPKIEHGDARAYYRPSSDTVHIPPAEVFTGDAEYYSTIFHELTHSTGHPSRLGRLDTDSPAPFGSNDYSQEELVAEMGAAFLCGHCRIENRTIDNSAAYIQGWLRRLRNDKRKSFKLNNDNTLVRLAKVEVAPAPAFLLILPDFRPLPEATSLICGKLRAANVPPYPRAKRRVRRNAASFSERG